MPGFEMIGEEERAAVDRIFTHGSETYLHMVLISQRKVPCA